MDVKQKKRKKKQPNIKNGCQTEKKNRTKKTRTTLHTFAVAATAAATVPVR